MQETRRMILDILRERGQATVDDVVHALHKRRGSNITAVTVRHHLNILQKEDLITSPDLRRRSTPGRPQRTYKLTEKARASFPNNYQRLAVGLLEEIQKHFPKDSVNVILEGVATSIAQQANVPPLPMHERLEIVVAFLSENGYDADWESSDSGYVLHTSNCPYHQIAKDTPALCDMDMRLVATLLGVVPRRLSHKADGDSHCSYFIPDAALQT